MSEPQYDSTGAPANDAARQAVAAAQREAAEQHDRDHEPPVADDLPAGSWRRQLRDYEPDTATLTWDGEEWDIPAKMPNTFYEATRNGDARGVVESILGIEGLAKLRIPRDVDAELMGDLAVDLTDAAGKVWDVPNLSRSARRSRGTTRR